MSDDDDDRGRRGRLYRDTQEQSTSVEVTGLNYELMVESARLEAARRFGVPASRITTHAGSMHVAETVKYRRNLGVPETAVLYSINVRCVVMPEDIWRERQENPDPQLD